LRLPRGLHAIESSLWNSPMRKLLVLILPVLLAGCQGGDSAPPAQAPVTPSSPPVDKPATYASTAICLVNGESTVTVGSAAATAFKAFPPLRDGDIGIEQLPEGFLRPYQAKSWETAGRGFGVILYDEVVEAAMFQEDQVSDEAVDKVVRDHQAKLGALSPETVAGERASYWFWEVDGQRLMICAFKNGRGTDLTLAMGDNVVMNKLGASVQDARTSIKRISDILATPKQTGVQTTP